jgi:hypothetical protein
MTIYKWSQTAGSNDTADSSINWQENQAPSTINNSARAMMAAIAKFRDDIGGNIATGGTSTAYTVSSNQVISANTNGFQVAFTPHTDCGSPVTLAVDGQTAKPLRPYHSVEFLAGQIKGGGIYVATYNTANSEWIVEGFFSSQPLDATLTALSGLTVAANKIVVGTGADAFSTIDYSTVGASAVNVANKPALKALGELSQAVTASGASLGIDMSLGWSVALTLSANVTGVTVSNWPTNNIFGRLVLDIASTGSFTMTGWPGTTRWSGGVAPTITSGSGKKDTIVLTSTDGGTNFRGFIVAQNMS